jgi:hypothetical protein
MTNDANGRAPGGTARDEALDRMIAEAVRNAPEASPPEGFSARVMDGLPPRRPSAWLRLRLWLTRPRSVTFTPARVLPGLAVAVVLLAVGVFLPHGAGGPGGSATPDGPTLSTVRFVLGDAAATARTVSVIGSFNDWKAEASAMRYDPDAGVWVLEAQLPQGDHEYMFLVDGRPVADPGARLTRDDGFGNTNAILIVNGRHEETL